MNEVLALMLRISHPKFRRRLALLGMFALLVSLIDITALYFFAVIFSSMLRQESFDFLQKLQIFGLRTENLNQIESYKFGVTIVLALVLFKTISILFLNKKIVNYLATEYTKSSEEIISKFVRLDYSKIKLFANYEVFLAVNSGVRDIFVIGFSGVLNACVESIIILILSVAILAHGGTSVLYLLIYFVLAFYVINRITGSINLNQSQILSQSGLGAATVTQSIVESFREIRIFNTFRSFIASHTVFTKISARASAKMQFINYIPKIVIESTFIVGVALFTLIQISIGNIGTVVIDITFFIAMGSRIIPSLLRLQFSLNQLKQVHGSSNFTQKLMALEKFSDNSSTGSIEGKVSHADFHAEISIQNVSFAYANSTKKVITDFSLNINPGESVGIVGRTGSGKSTIIDLILGAQTPDEGKIRVSGRNPAKNSECLEGKISYVPQSINLIDGTIRDNILLGRDAGQFSLDTFLNCLELSGLREFVESLPEGLEHRITRSGSELSVGQKQKLGIARALLNKPQLLLLDEATSSLDQESENHLNVVMSGLKSSLTLIVVAHRLSTVKGLDRIILMDLGKIVAEGSFSDLETSNDTFRSFVQYSRI